MAISSRPVRPDFERAQRLLQALLEGAADRHHLADRLHRGGQRRLGAGKLLEGEARNLGDDVVDGGLERGRGSAAGDVVGDLVERVADRELGGDLGDRKAGRLGGERRGARHPRIHLDDDEASVGRIDRELHVRAAGLHPDLAQHRDRGVAHDLVFLVGERERRRDGDGIAGMHPHRVQVLDRADDDAVVVLVANDLHLVFLPAEHRFLDQHLVGGRGIDAALDDLDELGLVVGDAAAGAAEREGRPDDGRQADVIERLKRGRQGLDVVRARRLQADAMHRLAKPLAVLGLVDGIRGGADHLDVELGQHAHLAQRQRAIEGGLPAHGRQQRVRAFLLDDLGDDLGGDRLDIGRIGEVGVGHDRGRVRIHQHDPITLRLQGLAGLRARIVELAGLADHDRAGADDQDRGDVGPLGHPDVCFRSQPARARSRGGEPVLPSPTMRAGIKKGRAVARPGSPGASPPRRALINAKSPGREGARSHALAAPGSAPRLYRIVGRTTQSRVLSHLASAAGKVIDPRGELASIRVPQPQRTGLEDGQGGLPGQNTFPAIGGGSASRSLPRKQAALLRRKAAPGNRAAEVPASAMSSPTSWPHSSKDSR